MFFLQGQILSPENYIRIESIQKWFCDTTSILFILRGLIAAKDGTELVIGPFTFSESNVAQYLSFRFMLFSIFSFRQCV